MRASVHGAGEFLRGGGDLTVLSRPVAPMHFFFLVAPWLPYLLRLGTTRYYYLAIS